jgi:hypothetical protein
MNPLIDEPQEHSPAPTVSFLKNTRDGYMADAKGRLVPTNLVKPEHRLEDELVRTLHAGAVRLSEKIRHFREKTTADILAFMDLLSEQYGAQRGGPRGNLTLTTFDGTLRVQLATNDQLEFGPELQVAKELVDACIKRWSEGATTELMAIVDDAFNVDQKGKLNTDRILALRRLAITDPEWALAMTAISDAIRVISTKRYLRFYSRGAPDEKFVQVPLDIASA